jgi:ATP-dependent Lhr-like helicase
VARRGYFVEGLGGAQFALPGAVERLRSQPERDAAPVVLSAVDPSQPYGGALPWPEGVRDSRRPARTTGAYVVLTGGEPILYLERGGRGLQTLVPEDDPRVEPALVAIIEQVRAGRIKRLALEKIDGQPALGSRLAAVLVALGFQEGPRRITLSA